MSPAELTSSLRMRGLRSLRRLAMTSSVCYRMARTLPRPLGGAGRAARSEPLGKELLERLAADRVVRGQVITTAETGGRGAGQANREHRPVAPARGQVAAG